MACTAHYAIRAIALAFGSLAVLFGGIAVAAAAIGDKYLASPTLIVVTGALTVLGIAAAAATWWRPVAGAVGMAMAAVGYWFVLAATWAPFWAGYQSAVQTSGATENEFWSSGAMAVPLLALGGICLVAAAILAALGHQPSPNARRRTTLAAG